MRKLLSILLLLPIGIISSAVYAQNNELVLEEVVVTATKKEENVQSIAQTVNAVTGADIDDYQIRELGELSQLVSGVEFTQIDPRRSVITIRGQKVDPDGGNDQPIQAYIDEMPVRPQVAFYQMYDTERVEILKGAQGTLQGVVSTGGALQIYTRDAEIGSDARNGYLKTSFADNNTSILEYASDVGISDTMALRFAAVTNDTGGNEVRNIRNGQEEDHEYDSFRISLNWEPSDNMSVRLKYQNMESTSEAPRAVAGSEGPITIDLAGYVNPATAGMLGPAQTYNSYAHFVGSYLGFLAMLPGGAAGAAQLATLHRPTYNDLSGPLDPEDRKALHFQRAYQNNSGETLNLMVDYDMGSHLFSLRVSDYENDTLGLIDRDYAGAFVYGYPQEVRTNAGIETFEARLSNQDNDKLEYTIGVFNRDSETFTHADLDRSYAVTEVAPFLYKPLVPFDYKTPFNACEADLASPGLFAARSVVMACTDYIVNNKTEAVFANFKYNISDQTFVQFGFREQELEGYRSQQIYLPLTQLVGIMDGGGSSFELIPQNLMALSSESTTGNFKIGHFVDDDVLLYFAVEQGYRSPGGTLANTPIAPSLVPFAEEETDMTEIGMKGTFLDGRLRLNAAYYDYTFDNYQRKWDDVTAMTYGATGATGQTAQVQGGIFNNNDASMTGMDIEYKYIVNENLVLGGSFTQSESEFDSGSIGYINDPTYTGPTVASMDVSGMPLNDAAETSWTFYLDHTVPSYAGGERYTRYNINWRDARDSGLNKELSIEELYLANIFLGWRSADGQWDVNVFVKNMLDDVDLAFVPNYYTEYGMPGGSGLPSKFYEASTNRGRQVGFQVTFNF